MRFRKLRIAFSATCLIACVLLIVLWVRSYRDGDQLYGPLGSSEGIFLTSQGGVLYCMRDLKLIPPSWQVAHEHSFNWFGTAMVRGQSWGFNSSPQTDYLAIPYWFPVLLSTALGALSWLRFRFTLRTLLIATTLVAVVLGLIVAVLRWPAG